MPIHELIIFAGVSLFGYLFGSLSSAIIVCKTLNLPDPRTEGSNNPGATNVLRIGGKKAAALTLAGDVAKGIIPIFLLQWTSLTALDLDSRTGISMHQLYGCCGISAVLGHLFPLFYNFQGGKGVATAFGIAHIWAPLLGISIDLIWLIVAATTRYSSLASLTSWLAAIPVSVLFFPKYAPFIAVLSGLLVFKHNTNIYRLIQGTEPKIGQKRNNKY